MFLGGFYIWNTLSSIQFDITHMGLVFILNIIFVFFGSVTFTKILIQLIQLFTKHKNIINICIILFTFLITIFVISFIESISSIGLRLDNASLGIIYQMVGFFIYLNPISKYLSELIIGDEELNIDHSIIIKTISITLVMTGLLLQLSQYILN